MRPSIQNQKIILLYLFNLQIVAWSHTNQIVQI